MATGGDEQVGYSLANVGTVTLENANETPDYDSIVICQNKIIVLDNNDDNNYNKVRIHQLHDGKFLDMLDSDSSPSNICLMDATTICVLHEDGLIEMASIKSENMSPVFTRMKSFRLDGVFDDYHSVVRVQDNIVVVGKKQNTTYWCIVSLDDGHVDTIHRISKKSTWSSVTTKDNIIYALCDAGVADDNTGVYAFDILNPSQCKYKYKHKHLRYVTSIVINEDGNIFVGNYGVRDNSYIHQLTASCQLVAIFTEGIPRGLYAMFWDNGRLYVACWGSHDVTVFRHVYQGSHKESEVLVSDERKLPGIEESAIHISQGNVDNGQSSVETEMPPSAPSPEDSKDDTQGNLAGSEVSISDEGKQPVIEGTSAQIGQEMVDNGQSSVETETPPSGTCSKDFEDEKQGKHTDSEVPFSDEDKQLVIEGTSTQIGQEIPIEQSVEETLIQAGIMMSTEERNLFIKFQNKIGTDIYFSKGTHRLNDGQENLNVTEIFIEQSHPDMKEKWHEYKSQGKLTPELIDVIYAEKRNPDLHANKNKFLKYMENLNIIVKAMSFDENGVKEENYFNTPCMLHPESEREVIAPEQDPHLLSTTLCWEFERTCFPYSVFDRLLAACMKRWPVAKDTSQHLISPGHVVFDLDLVHRLTVKCENHVIFATVMWLANDNIETPDADVCTTVRMFISHKLSTITDSLNFQYELFLQTPDSRISFAPFRMWFKDKVDDPESPITHEHINHVRLYIALATVCGKALREMLLDNVPEQHNDIYNAILANHAKLTGKTGRGRLLNVEQIKKVFPDPLLKKTRRVEMFDISLLYIFIRNVSTVPPPTNGWGSDPPASDTSLGASVERIRKYRNKIGGHSPDAKIDSNKFYKYWTKFEDVLRHIEAVNNRKYCEELDRHKGQVISIFNAC